MWKSKSNLLYDGRSVSQHVLVSGTPLGLMTRFYFFLSLAGKFHCSLSWGAVYDERTIYLYIFIYIYCMLYSYYYYFLND
jgi:hypothetical protein